MGAGVSGSTEHSVQRNRANAIVVLAARPPRRDGDASDGRRAKPEE